MNSSSLNSILLVDDDEISNLFNKIFIGKLNLNVKVDFALNGREALDLLIPSKDYTTVATPCLLLLDIKMPIMDGWKFLEYYAEEVDLDVQNKTTIIMLTTSCDEGDMVKALNDPNIKEFVQKPLSETVIRELIGKYFSNSKRDK